jgi:phosphohistidine phosphatase
MSRSSVQIRSPAPGFPGAFNNSEENVVKLLIIRHAIAAARETAQIPDEDRPLTEYGMRRFKVAARGLIRICGRPDLLLTSPFLRALTTAEIVAEAWGKITPTHESSLAHGSPQDIINVLSQHTAHHKIAIVGHEPLLSGVLARLLSSGDARNFALRKGGVALVDIPGPLSEGGRLDWLLRPKILRELA